MRVIPSDTICFPENYLPFVQRNYSEEIHARRLICMIKLMIGKRELDFCPASENFDSMSSPEDIWNPEDVWDEESTPCKICKQFVDIDPDKYCPCIVTNSKKALKDTIKKLHEKGYISLDEKKSYLDSIQGLFEELESINEELPY